MPTHRQTHSRTLVALSITSNLSSSAWHLAARRRVLCQDAPCGDTVEAVSHTMVQCVWQSLSVSAFYLHVCVFMWVAQTPLCHEIACVYTVYACLCETVASAGHKNRVPPLCPLPPQQTPRPIEAPRVPETPCSRPVLMSPGPTNSFNHPLIPKAGQAD